MDALPPDFQSLHCVLVVDVDSDGRLLQANAAMGDICLSAPVPGESAEGFFIQPTLGDLGGMPEREDGLVYQGLLTVGDRMGLTQTLSGTVRRNGDVLRVVAEPDLAEMASVSASMLQLNAELADAQRQLIRAHRDLNASQTLLRELSLTDPMTGAANRRSLDDVMVAEQSRSLRYGTPLCIVACDIDHLKLVNDRWGHDVGDAVLKHFVMLMKMAVRPTDTVVRTGGDEFCIVLSQTALDDALMFAQRIRIALGGQTVPPLQDVVTGSFGVAQLDKNETIAQLFKRADTALYQAKASGRNRCIAVKSADPAAGA